MNLRQWLARKIGGTPQNADLSGLSFAEFNDWVKGGMTSASTIVTDKTAWNIGAVYACVSLIGGAVASMPLHFYRRDVTTGDRERITPTEWWLLNEAFFDCWPAAVAWEYMLASLLLQGDAFVRIHRVGGVNSRNPAIAGFEPLHPRTVMVRRYDDRLRYQISPQPSQAWTIPKPAVIVLDQDDVLHIPGPGFDGLRGMSQIASALAQVGGASLSADQYSNSFFSNQARPDFVLKTAQNMGKDQIEAMRDQWNKLHGNGAGNAWKPAILTNGLEVQPVTMTSDDAQLIEQRGLHVEDIARIFGVPPTMIGKMDKATSWGTGVEQLAIGFVKFTLQRHLVKIEQEINRKVFRTAARFCEFQTAGLERGDITTRNNAYRIALGRAGEDAWQTINEVRRMENLPPVPGGDKLKKATDAAPPAKDPAQSDNNPAKEGTNA